MTGVVTVRLVDGTTLSFVHALSPLLPHNLHVPPVQFRHAPVPIKRHPTRAAVCCPL